MAKQRGSTGTPLPSCDLQHLLAARQRRRRAHRGLWQAGEARGDALPGDWMFAGSACGKISGYRVLCFIQFRIAEHSQLVDFCSQHHFTRPPCKPLVETLAPQAWSRSQEIARVISSISLYASSATSFSLDHLLRRSQRRVPGWKTSFAAEASKSEHRCHPVPTILSFWVGAQRSSNLSLRLEPFLTPWQDKSSLLGWYDLRVLTCYSRDAFS